MTAIAEQRTKNILSGVLAGERARLAEAITLGKQREKERGGWRDGGGERDLCFFSSHMQLSLGSLTSIDKHSGCSTLSYLTRLD